MRLFEPKPLGAKSLALLIVSFLLAVFGRTVACTLSFFAMFYLPMTPFWVTALWAIGSWAGWSLTGVGVGVFAFYALRTRFQVNAQAMKRSFRKVSVVATLVLVALAFSCLFTEPMVKANLTDVTNYYLATPFAPCGSDWYIGQYVNGNYFAINGSNWNNLVAVEPWQSSPPWASLTSNATGLITQVLRSISAGEVYLKEVAFPLSLMSDIPANVQVVDNVNGVTYTYINPSSSLGSPYTVSVGEGNNVGYYVASDSGGRVCFTSTDCPTLFNEVIATLPSSGGKIAVASGEYFFDYTQTINNDLACVVIEKCNVTIAGAGIGNTVFYMKNGQNATFITLYNQADYNTISRISFDGNKANNPTDSVDATSPCGVVIDQGSSFNTVENCYFYEMKSHSVLIITASTQNLITDNKFYNNNWFDVAATSATSYGNVFSNNLINDSVGMESYLGASTIFEGNSLYNTPGPTITTHSNAAIHLSGRDTVCGNYIYNSSQNAISLPDSCQFDQVYGNVIVNPCQSKISLEGGIYVSGEDNNIYGNTITGSLESGIYLQGSGNTVSSNTVSQSALNGIQVPHGSNNVVTENTVFNSTNTDLNDNGTCIDCTFSNNNFPDSTASVIIYEGGTNDLIEGNLLTNDANIGIELVGARTTVKNNYLYNVATGVSFPSAAIYELSGISGLLIQGNTLINTGSAKCGIDLRGGSNIVEYNNVTGFATYGIFDYSQTGNRIMYNNAPIELYTSTTKCICEYNVVSSLIDLGSSNMLVGNVGYNPKGYIANPILGSSIVDSGSSSSWTSGTTYTCWQSPKILYISGGVAQAITINGQSTGLTSGTFTIQPSWTFSITFIFTPTITVYGQ